MFFLPLITSAQVPLPANSVQLFNAKVYTASNNDTSAVIQNLGNSNHFTLFYRTNDSAVATSYVQTRPRWGNVTGSWTTAVTDSGMSVALTSGSGTITVKHYTTATYGFCDYRFINVFRAGTKLKTTSKTYDEVLFWGK